MSTSSGSERCTALPRMLLLLLLIAITGLLQAQTSSSMANTVVDFDWSLPLAHEDLFYSAWLKPDGTFAVIDSYLVYEGSNFAPDVQQSQPGTWAYIAESATNGRLILAQNGNGGPTLTLSFSTPTTGTVAAQGGAGSFVVRPSLAGSGPANLSSQSTLSAGGSATSGFVLPGTTSRFVLVRAIGPGLSPFGLAPTAQGLSLNIFKAGGVLIGKGVDWATDAGLAAQYNADFSAFGPFPLTAGAGDLCYLAELAPGAYTVQITAASAGNAMTEMYFLP